MVTKNLTTTILLVALAIFSYGTSVFSLPTSATQKVEPTKPMFPTAKWLHNEILRHALKESVKPSAQWSVQQRDCAGYIRFVYSRALKTSTPIWQDASGAPAFFVNAETLVQRNFTRLSGQIEEEKIETGDVLVYYFPEKKKTDRWHLMLLLKKFDGSNRDILVSYHNGDQGLRAEIRRVWLRDLEAAPVTEWRPNAENAHFKGVYRWKGLL